MTAMPATPLAGPVAPGDAQGPEAQSAALAALGLYSQADVKASAFARLLVIGPPKLGKTTAIVTTSPGPILVINCDGDSALKYPTHLGAKFSAIDVRNRKDWARAVAVASQAVAKGLVRTVVVDSASLLADDLLAEIAVTLDGFDRYSELASVQAKGYRTLLDLPAHIVIVCHMTAPLRNADGTEKGGDEGIAPMIAGKIKSWLPATVNDIVLFDYQEGRAAPPNGPGPRAFLLGPQKNWNYSGRGVRRTCALPADMRVLYAEIGVTP